VRGEDMQLRPLALASPFVVVTLPVMALVAAMAVVFEATPGLRGGLGNVVYFFFWMTSISLTAAMPGGGRPDALGGAMLISQMHAACVAAFPDFPPGRNFSMGFNIKLDGVWDLKTFAWGGVVWTPAMLGARAAWAAAGLALTLLAALWFDRFDVHAASGRGPGRRRPLPTAAGESSMAAVSPRPNALIGARMVTTPGSERSRAAARPGAGRSRLGGLVLAEVRIMLQGVSRWWFVVVLGLIATGLFVPLAGVRQFVAPFALVWPLLLWSPMGTRERVHRTDGLLFSAPRPVARLLVAQWSAGVVIAVMVTSGALIRFALTGHWTNVAALLVAAAFVPSLALGLGTWSGSPKLFEVLYLMLWYMGPMNSIPMLDYVGVTQPESGAGPPVRFLVLTIGLAGLALLGRARQLRR